MKRPKQNNLIWLLFENEKKLKKRNKNNLKIKILKIK